PEGAGDLDQLLLGWKLAEAGKTLTRRLDVGPAHDPVSIDQELALELRELPLKVFLISLGRGEALHLVELLSRLRNRQGARQLPGRVDSRLVYGLEQLRRDRWMRQAVRAMGDQFRIRSEWRPRWAKTEVEARVVGGRCHDGERFHTEGLELACRRAELRDGTATERAVEAPEHGQ